MKYGFSTLLGLIVVAAVAVGFLLDRDKVSAADKRAQDMVEIEKLHHQDVSATLTGDPATLAQLWTDDAVRLEQGEDAVVGRQAIQAADERGRKEHPNARIITYAPDIKDVTIEGNWAFEWGYFSGSYTDGTKKEATPFRAKLLRVLKRQENGSWRFARVMWNTSE